MRKLINVKDDDSYLDIALELVAAAIVAMACLVFIAIGVMLTISVIVGIVS